MGDELQVLTDLFDEKILNILEVFVNNEGKDFYLRELSTLTKVPPATTFRIINKLLKLKIIELTEIKNLKIYKLSTTKQADFLKKILYSKPDPLEAFIGELINIEDVQIIATHAKPQRNSAFILVAGDKLPIIQINDLSDVYEANFDYKIKILPLSVDQYEMLDSSHTGYKKVLFKR